MQTFHLLLVLPVVALIGTPFFPFVNSPDPWFGLPSVVVWVGVWCVLTSLVLAWVLRQEERTGHLSSDAEAGPDLHTGVSRPGEKGGREA